MAKYETCKKCGQRHSALVRHKCPTKVTKRAEAECEITEHDFTEGKAGTDLSAKSDGTSDGEGEGGERGREGGAPAEGEGEGEGGEEGGDDEAEGEGEGKGEGESESESESEGREPQPPEPKAPPVAVVVTVLKFAALTAACVEDAFVEVKLSERGLVVVALKGDDVATTVMDWGEFEERSTLDGEYMVKDAIDATAAEVIEKHEARDPEFAEVDDDGWIAWEGGGRPVDNHVVVQVIRRGTEKSDRVTPPHREAEEWTWGHSGHSGDILFYRIV